MIEQFQSPAREPIVLELIDKINDMTNKLDNRLSVLFDRLDKISRPLDTKGVAPESVPSYGFQVGNDLEDISIRLNTLLMRIDVTIDRLEV